MRSDEELADAFRSGDDGAFSILYERYRRPLYVFGVRMLGSAEAAGDLVQDTFLGIYERRQELQSLRNFRGWLFTVGRNRCLTLLRLVPIYIYVCSMPQIEVDGTRIPESRN